MSESVMEQIRGLQQAREEFQRDKFRADAELKMRKFNPDALERTVIEWRSMLESTTPVAIQEGKSTTLKAAMDELAANVDIPDSDLSEEALKRYRQFIEVVARNGEDLASAYENVTFELEKASNPFSEADMTSYMIERQLVGDLPNTHDQLCEAVRAATYAREPGAILFWQRNLEKVSAKITSTHGYHPAQQAGVRNDLESLKKRLADAVSAARNDEQKAAARRLDILRARWNGQKIPLLIDRTKAIKLRMANAKTLPRHAAPRERTELESNRAETREMSRELKRRLDAGKF